MMKNVVFILFAILLTTHAPAQTKSTGVNIPNSLSYEGAKLNLNGVGVREKYWMNMYAGALYLNSKSIDANAILVANEPMAIKIHIVSKLISSDKMIEAVNEGFKSSAKGNTAPISAEIEKFKNFFEEEISKNDIFDLVYLPTRGVVVYKIGTEKGTIKDRILRRRYLVYGYPMTLLIKSLK
jgi:hypothetical protein